MSKWTEADQKFHDLQVEFMRGEFNQTVDEHKRLINEITEHVYYNDVMNMLLRIFITGFAFGVKFTKDASERSERLD